jgi:hypothetical protein
MSALPVLRYRSIFGSVKIGGIKRRRGNGSANKMIDHRTNRWWVAFILPRARTQRNEFSTEMKIGRQTFRSAAFCGSQECLPSSVIYILPMALFGAHLSIAGGCYIAVLAARSHGCEVLQLFT